MDCKINFHISKNNGDLEMYNLISLYEDLSTLYEDSYNLLSETDICSI